MPVFEALKKQTNKNVKMYRRQVIYIFISVRGKRRRRRRSSKDEEEDVK
jgi:hypothetical protein